MVSSCARAWLGLGWAGLGWAGLGWAGLGWAGLGRARRSAGLVARKSLWMEEAARGLLRALL